MVANDKLNQNFFISFKEVLAHTIRTIAAIELCYRVIMKNPANNVRFWSARELFHRLACWNACQDRAVKG